ncbi:Thioredoxin reductase [Clostridium cavendishii DSM 21758]|uniref:Thioredoxin reductase n=1 Tax=Clostridium cavendishii DSM 21758 TaxID=1121302 RepID=A0A1M6U9Z2_9CLOT|nr:Thioredoxin reductase [Clostridium cavendishii DSM 21758]
MHEYDIVVVGGGPSGMAAAIEARKQGILKVLLLEREDYLGGVLNQCIHNRFGRNILNKDITGPEYAQYFIEQIQDLGIEYKLNTMVLSITTTNVVSYVNPEDGMKEIEAKAIILATGSREKYTGNINIPSNKFAGIYTVGTAHKLVNVQGYLPGKEIVIFGASDISLIVARRLIVEGANVKAIIEASPNIISGTSYSEQIAEAFNISIKHSYTIHEVLGNERIEKVVVGKINNNGEIQEDSLETIECDALLLSVGWLPETELAEGARIKMSLTSLGPKVDSNFLTSQKGVYACGNLIHAYSLADKCTEEGYRVGKSAAEYVKNSHL